jgi:hypothetical protein
MSSRARYAWWGVYAGVIVAGILLIVLTRH